MQLYDALFVSKQAALTAVVRAAKHYGISSTTVIKRGKAKPVYRRGQLIGYHAIYPTTDGSVAVVKETYDGTQKCYHLN